jgi:thiamine transport system substrate-binding protein
MRKALLAVLLAAMAVATIACTSASTDEATEVRVVVHSSFDANKDLIAAFEQEYHAKVTLLKGGDANEVVNRAVLNAGNPEGDVLYGIDNLTFPRVAGKGVFEDFTATRREQIPADMRAQFGDSRAVTPIDYGYVALNFDRAQGTPPATLEELTKPAWRGKLAVEDPATSSPGLQFLATTVAHFGETGSYTWRNYWADLKANGVQISDGWDAAYNKEFSRNGGTRPLVVSYTTSPAAEVYFSEGKLTEPPTVNVLPKDVRVFRQVEAAGVLAGAKHPELARKFIDFMLRDAFQQQIPETMFVYPVVPGIAFPEWWHWADVSVQPATLTVDAVTVDRWIREWTETMRR